ncbi:hypothetical protein PanWU01x14_077260, partial [Parasponia andersonii]
DPSQKYAYVLYLVFLAISLQHYYLHGFYVISWAANVVGAILVLMTELDVHFEDSF